MSHAHRRFIILQACASASGATRRELAALCHPAISPRTLSNDLKWLRDHYESRFTAIPEGREIRWRFTGPLPHLLSEPIAWLDGEQITALIAARGLLHQPTATDLPAERKARPYRGVLAQALDRLLEAADLRTEANRLSPEDLCVSRFGVAEEPEGIFLTVLAAIQTATGLRFQYTNMKGITHPVHAQPVRLVSIHGEWYLYAWASDTKRPPGYLKQYRLSRMADLATAPRPAQCPHSGLRQQVNDTLVDAFGATGSDRPADRVRVRLGVAPELVQFLIGRRWGADQRFTPGPHPGLPPAWHLLEFVTTGLAEVVHKVLSFGKSARVLGPPALVNHLKDHIAHLIAQEPPGHFNLPTSGPESRP